MARKDIPINPKKNLYIMMDLDKRADKGEVQKIYKRLDMEYHPDKMNHNNGRVRNCIFEVKSDRSEYLIKKFQELHNVYEALSSPSLRPSSLPSRRLSASISHAPPLSSHNNYGAPPPFSFRPNHNDYGSPSFFRPDTNYSQPQEVQEELSSFSMTLSSSYLCGEVEIQVKEFKTRRVRRYKKVAMEINAIEPRKLNKE